MSNLIHVIAVTGNTFRPLRTRGPIQAMVTELGRHLPAPAPVRKIA